MSRSREPRVAIFDASAALGGALTSAVALADVLRAGGASVQLVAVREVEREVADAFDHAVTLTVRRFGDTRGRRFYTRELNRARALRRLWKARRPDVVLLNNAPAPNAAGWLAARALGLPVVQYVRGPLPDTGLGRVILNDVDDVFTVGAVATSAARTLGARPTTVDEGLSGSRWPRARVEGATDWLFAASGHAWKGAAEIIEAYGAVRRERRLPRLWVCLTQGEVADPVSLPDPLPPGVVVRWNEVDLDGVRARCRAFLHHSQRPEPFGRALLEAMAAGLCPVAADEGGPAGRSPVPRGSGVRARGRLARTCRGAPASGCQPALVVVRLVVERLVAFHHRANAEALDHQVATRAASPT
jgi:glycosyltransferase involved in cell wall biosynthesis